jgi:DNA-binding transcriptional LysR family regulator
MVAGMELRHLRYFIAVAEALNFTRAAEKMHVAQPALSKQVRDLEDEIGVDLFRRSQRGVTLTAEGKLFLDEARRILGDVGEAVKKTQALARGEVGELNIGYASAPTIEILPRALAEFQLTAPKVALNLYDWTGNAICDGLRSGHLELAITALPSEQNLHGLTFDLLKAYSLVVAMPQGHPLAKSRQVSVKRLLDYPLITYSKREYMDYHVMLDDLFEPHGGAPRPSLEVDRATTLIAAVASGRGLALVTELFGRTCGSRLKLRPLAGSETAVKVGIVTAKDADVTPAGVEFCKVLRKFAGA